jgi:hypothetical protein
MLPPIVAAYSESNSFSLFAYLISLRAFQAHASASSAFQRNACFVHLCSRRSFSKALEVRDYASEDCRFVLNKVGQHLRLPISSAF